MRRTFTLASTERFDSEASRKAWESRDRPWSSYQHGKEEWLVRKHSSKRVREAYGAAYQKAVSEAAARHLPTPQQLDLGHAAGMQAARAAGYRPRRFKVPGILTGIADAISSIDQGF